MKKEVLKICIMMLAVFALSACGRSDGGSKSVTNNNSPKRENGVKIPKNNCLVSKIVNGKVATEGAELISVDAKYFHPGRADLSIPFVPIYHVDHNPIYFKGLDWVVLSRGPDEYMKSLKSYNNWQWTFRVIQDSIFLKKYWFGADLRFATEERFELFLRDEPILVNDLEAGIQIECSIDRSRLTRAAFLK